MHNIKKLTWNGDFSFPWMSFQNQKTTNEFLCSSCLYNMILSFFRYHFETLQVVIASLSHITQREQPRKNSEDNNEVRVFWDPNSQNIY